MTGGQKPAIAPSKVIDAVMMFRERVTYLNKNGVQRVTSSSDIVWKEIKSCLNGCMSSKAIHAFVNQNKHGIKEKLGFYQISKKENVNSHKNLNSSDTNPPDTPCNDNYSSDDGNLSKIAIVFSFSQEEWQKIKPKEVTFHVNNQTLSTRTSQTYVLVSPPKAWSPIFKKHFWAHTQLPCTLTFQRAKVNLRGSNFLEVVGKCTICGSNFKGIVSTKPLENAVVLMQCAYTGNFKEPHEITKKRHHMVDPASEKMLTCITDKEISSESSSQNEAHCSMKTRNLSYSNSSENNNSSSNKKFLENFNQLEPSSSSPESDKFCPSSMLRYDDAKIYKTVFVCRICLKVLLDEKSARNHLIICFLPKDIIINDEENTLIVSNHVYFNKIETSSSHLEIIKDPLECDEASPDTALETNSVIIVSDESDDD